MANVIGLEFDIEIYEKEKGKPKTFGFRIYSVYPGGMKEIIKPMNITEYKVSDIFDKVILCNDPFKFELRCEYGENPNLTVYIRTPMSLVDVGSLKSRYGDVYFPVYPTFDDIEELKMFIEKIKNKLEELKKEYSDHKKEKLSLGRKASY